MAGKEDAGHSGKDSGNSGLGALFSPPNARLSTGGSGELQIVERVVRETESAAHFTPLTRTNYAEWTILMKVQLQALGLWDVVEDGPGDFREDRRAMSILLRAVPPEQIRTLGGKETAKEAWETLKVMRVGVQRVREAKAQTRWTEFEKLAFREGEGVESFGIRLTAIVNDLEVLGDPVTEHKAVLKFLRSMSRQYKRRAWDWEEQSDDAEETKPCSFVVVYTREERVSKLSDQNKIWKPGDTSGRPSSDRPQIGVRTIVKVGDLMACIAKNCKLSYCKVVEVVSETTAPLTPLEELLVKIPSQRAEIYSPKEVGAAAAAASDLESSKKPSTPIERVPSKEKVLVKQASPPYIAYEDLKTPTSPRPTPPGPRKNPLDASEQVNISSTPEETVPESSGGIDATASSVIVSPQKLTHCHSPYPAYDDFKPPSTPSPSPPCTSPLSTLAAGNGTQPGTLSVSSTVEIPTEDTESDKDQCTKPKPQSPFTMYEDLKPPASPIPSYKS